MLYVKAINYASIRGLAPLLLWFSGNEIEWFQMLIDLMLLLFECFARGFFFLLRTVAVVA
jgi:hypothetical protein